MNIYKKLFFLIPIFTHFFLFPRKMQINSLKAIENNVRNRSWFKIVPLEQILKIHTNILCKKCFGSVDFKFKKFPLSSLFPHEGHFKECFILEIPRGIVQGKNGLVFFDNAIIQEMVWADRYEFLQNIPSLALEKARKVSGRVAVLSQESSDNFCHFFYEVLARLAMLEMHDVEYDWLYVTCDKGFIKEGLKLWGIDESKIICPTDKDFYIQADTVIVPSLVLNTNNGFKHTGVNAHPYTLKYVREKLLFMIKDTVDMSQFSKKIFISRRDAPSRRIINENEVFELFKAKGFERYDTGKMSVAEQIALFAQSEVVVGEHGAGLTGIIFCKEMTKIIELFQALIDSSFWFPAQIFNLNYIAVNTLGIDGNSFYNWQERNLSIYLKAMCSKINIPIEPIEKIIQNL
ncbi:glycosyltransferase family 61 protein [Candidatus Dependentiae bacterium]|nr:glycosyltransferase family 61 protein [Candidatus Dependentiae bacterium]